MQVTITLEHWNKAKKLDGESHGVSRILYCPIAQALTEMGFPNVEVVDGVGMYRARYGDTYGTITGCGAEVALTFDMERELPDGLLPCTIELPEPVVLPGHAS